jgi:23S rRNA pseudouridine1911/1915/1917 synthase
LALGRPFLHAFHLAFAHPATGKTVSFEAPMAADLASALAELR